MDNIVITGIGVISSLGLGVKANRQALQNGECGIGDIQFLKTKYSSMPVGEVKFSNTQLRQDMNLAQSGDISRTVILGIYAAREALAKAKVNNPSNVKLISGTTVGSMDITEDCYLKMTCDKKLVKKIDYHEAKACTDFIASYCQLRKDTITIATACSSGLNAIILAVRKLQQGKEDMILAGGSEALTKFHFAGFRTLRIMDTDLCRPFDKNRNGLNLGEGAGYLLLEREKDAVRRGAKILAYITGWNNTCEAFHQTASSPDGEGAYNSMKGAIENAGLTPDDIDQINVHGTGTMDNDQSEANAIMRLFGNNIPNISATKSYTGHTTSACGALESVFAVLSLERQFTPKSLRITDEIIPFNNRTSIHNILCNAFAFGGNDCSIVISDKPSKQPTKIEDCDFKISAKFELDEEEKLKYINGYIDSTLARRIGKILKSAIITSLASLNEAKIEKPDAIIIVTKYGMLENGEKFLVDMEKYGEDMLKPTLFIQSTHNTIATTLAMITKCHGYNVTYAEEGIIQAAEDAKMLIREGRAKKVLIGYHEESTEIFRQIINNYNDVRRRNKYEKPLRISSTAIIIEKNV